MTKGGCYWCRVVGVELEEGMCSDCAGSPYETPRAEITALRAAHEALLRRTQSLETALAQERAKVERLREYAQHTGAWCGQNMGHACTCGLDALLSGRGEGGNDG